MAKCTITFEDSQQSGVDIKVEFTPLIDNPTLEGAKPPTQAQAVGWQFAEAFLKANGAARKEEGTTETEDKGASPRAAT